MQLEKFYFLLPRNYIQNISEQVGQMIGQTAKSWEYSLPKAALGASMISFGIDGTTSYLVKEGYRETMSGTIAFFDDEGNRVHTIYIAQTPEYGKTAFKERFKREIEGVKVLCPNARYTAVADGASENWTFLTPYVDTTTLDFWHATEYLTPVSKIVSRVSHKQEEWYKEARRRLREEIGAAEKLLEEMKELRDKRMNKTKKEKLERAITYFTNHLHQMNYAECTEKGLPIGSGITEAACKVIVKERLCCSGMMWKQPGAQAVLNIRCLTHTEQRWEQFWKMIDQKGVPT